MITIYYTALFTAINKDNLEIVKLLLDNDKLDINIFRKICKIIFK